MLAGCREEEALRKIGKYTLGGKVNWLSHCGKQYGRFLENLKLGLPWLPAVSLVSRNKKRLGQNTRTPMFICSTIYNCQSRGPQPQVPITGGWIKTCGPYIPWVLLILKRKWKNAVAVTWMDLASVILVSKTEKEKSHDPASWNLKEILRMNLLQNKRLWMKMNLWICWRKA